MAARFHPITGDEIHDFLIDRGFQPLALKGVVERVYGKIVRVGNHPLSLRIYTAVNPNGESREKGADALRVQLFAKIRNGDNDEIVPVGRAQKCLRVKSWQENIRRAVQRIADAENYRKCPACGHPMVIRENRATGEEFWGCSMYRWNGCRGRSAPQCNRTKTPLIPEASEELAPWERDDQQE